MTPKKSILITGAGSGIGQCAAIKLHERGYQVIASARNPDDVKRLKELGLISIQLDVNDSLSIKKALTETLEITGGSLDALFNNAGFIQAGAVADLSREMIRRQFETNVFGAMELIHEVLPLMHQQGQGRIIQNSSILGVTTVPFYGAYTASKFALEGFSRTLRQELRNTNIHVSIINPGPITSELRQKGYQYFSQTVEKNTSSLYRSTYQRMKEIYFAGKGSENRITLGPEAVVKKLIHALESPRPKLHYYVGVPAKLLAVLKHCLPDAALDWLLGKIQ